VDYAHSRYYQYLLSAINEFVSFGTKERAFDVYQYFLDIYHVNPKNDKSFLDIFDVLKKYEENAARMTSHQRDHYSHSVYVFLLGICIYTNNSKYRHYFAGYIDKRCKPANFQLIDEEFLYCWGIASLFHDIGYPVEITSNQIKEYITMVTNVFNTNLDAGPYIDFLNFEALNSIQDINTNNIRLKYYRETSNNLADMNLLRPTDLLAYNISQSFDENLPSLKTTVNDFLKKMQFDRFVDHGFFSAIILLKWYGELLQQIPTPTSMFYNEIALSSEAIFLHNFYAGTLMKPPYNRPPVHPKDNALAYLLILCDESQEWNRLAYGGNDSETLFIDTAHVEVSETKLGIRYLTEQGIFKDNFAEERKAALIKRLVIEEIFADGLNLSAETLPGYYVENNLGYLVMPRLLIEQLENLAIMIHEDYVAKQIERNPTQAVEYPTWDSLPPSMKFSNIRQAAAIDDKLSKINCRLDAKQKSGETVTAFSTEEIEYLAIYEHDLWVRERIESGWVFGPVKDTRKKESPYLVPYNELSEEIKELDRDTIRNILPLADAVGLAVYRVSANGQDIKSNDTTAPPRKANATSEDTTVTRIEAKTESSQV
jgi:hypothetical protein